MSVSRRRRIAQMLQQRQSLLLYFHTPPQDDGDKPMMDLAQSLQTWYEHAVASICAQRPSWNSETETEIYAETETDSCQY